MAHASLRVYSPKAESIEELAQSAFGGGSGRLDGGKLGRKSEYEMIFLLELMVSVVLENRDRLMQIWPAVSRHLAFLLSRHFGRNPFIVERAVVSILRIVNRNLFRLNDERAIGEELFYSLSLLLKLRPPALFLFSRQIAFGLHAILHNNAANIHKKEHWLVFFSLMEAAGAAVYPEQEAATNSEDFVAVEARQIQSDDGMQAYGEHEERGYTSDNQMLMMGRRGNPTRSNPLLAPNERTNSVVSVGSNNGEWIHIEHKHTGVEKENSQSLPKPFDKGTLILATSIARHDPIAFLKVSETLGFLARDAAHITPDNFLPCTKCTCMMIEASIDGGRNSVGLPLSQPPAEERAEANVAIKMASVDSAAKTTRRAPTDDAQSETGAATAAEHDHQHSLVAHYENVSLQLLAISSTLYTKAPAIYRNWAALSTGHDHYPPSSLWTDCWRPCLQGMARLATDCRRKIRAHSLDCLGAALRLAELNQLGPEEWEDCFANIIFPLLKRLLTNISPMDPIGMEEIRVRAIQLVSKTVLFHLTTLSRMPSFVALFDALMQLMEEYLKCEGNDILAEAIPECLKNMILVLDNSGMFTMVPPLRELIFTKLSVSLPTLASEIFTSTIAVPTPSEYESGGRIEPVDEQQFVPLASLRVEQMPDFKIVKPMYPIVSRTSSETTAAAAYGIPPPLLGEPPVEPAPHLQQDCHTEGSLLPTQPYDPDAELISVVVDRR